MAVRRIYVYGIQCPTVNSRHIDRPLLISVKFILLFNLQLYEGC